MGEQCVLLTYFQSMIFLYKIDEISRIKPDFKDEVVEKFEKYFLEKMQRVIKDFPNTKISHKDSCVKYEINEQDFNYLVKITGINPTYKCYLDVYVPLIEQLEKKIILENLKIGVK